MASAAVSMIRPSRPMTAQFGRERAASRRRAACQRGGRAGRAPHRSAAAGRPSARAGPSLPPARKM
jgi:hypothetical protein